MGNLRTAFLAFGLMAAPLFAGQLAAQKKDPIQQLEDARGRLGLKPILDRDWRAIGEFLAAILGAIALGAALAYHPLATRKASLEDLDQPKIVITYSVVGALVAMVVAHIPEMGFAIFGIGALMRFRTELGAAKETGRVILSTVLGIACGLGFWMVALVGTVIAWVLIAVLEYRQSMRMVVRGLRPETLAQSATAYARALQDIGCRLSAPRKNPAKGQASFVLRARRNLEPEVIEAECNRRVQESLRGTVDWPEE